VASTAAEILAEIRAAIATQAAPREEVRTGVDDYAREVADYARSIAPVYDGPARPDVTSGAFRDSIHAEKASDHDGMPAARVVSESPIAALLEFGTSKMEKRPTFAKTAAKFGGGSVDRIDGGTFVSGEEI
jgi:hypothetical protein